MIIKLWLQLRLVIVLAAPHLYEKDLLIDNHYKLFFQFLHIFYCNDSFCFLGMLCYQKEWRKSKDWEQGFAFAYIKQKVFQKVCGSAVNYFYKILHLRCLTWFWMRLWWHFEFFGCFLANLSHITDFLKEVK